MGSAKSRTRLSDFTFTFHFHFSLSHIGEGNGNPLQCSCLENPRDGGAWWAAVYGVAQSQIRLTLQQQQQCVKKLDVRKLRLSFSGVRKLRFSFSAVRKLRSWHPVPSPHGK